MKELQLVGYTADLLHLVFTDAVEGGGRFKAPIDEDFVATLTEVMELVDPEVVPLGALVTGSRPVPERAPERAPDPAPEAAQTAAEYSGNGAQGPQAPRGEGPLAGMATSMRSGAEQGEAPASERARSSKLAPREIQALLRAGQGIRSVAKLADTDEQWVRRWLPPIEAERDQVLFAVRSSFVAKTRLGVSADPVGEAAEKNLAAKGVATDDPSVEWIAARREGDPHWKVTLRYRSRGRPQRATWHFNPETGALDPRNDLAVDIAWTRSRRPGRASAAASSTTGAGRRKAKKSGKKSRAKKSTAKKATAKKSTAKKATAKKATAKKSTAKKSTAKKSTAKKSTAKKSTVKKSTAKKSTAKKSTAKKSTAKKSTVKKSTAKKFTAKKAAAEPTSPSAAQEPASPATDAAPAQDSTAKKSRAKKSTAEKPTAKKSRAKKSMAEKSTAEKSTAKKSTAKKSTAKKSTAEKPADKAAPTAEGEDEAASRDAPRG